MQKQLKRTLTLLLLLALLLGIVPTGSAFRAYAAETETVTAETEETTEVSAAAEEPTPESEEETEPCEEPVPEEESKPAEENEAPREIDPGEGEATGTIVELEQIQPRDEVLASSYGLQIPVILYGAGNAFTVSFRYPNDTSQTTYNIKLTGFRYHYLNGQMAYCLEPQAESTPSAVYLHVLGETLAYQVAEINTVLPDETDLLLTVPDEDLCTLITCTPFGVNSHRLLVRGTRISYEQAEIVVKTVEKATPAESTWKANYKQGLMIGGGLAMGVILLGLLIAFLRKKRRKCHEA